LTEIDMAHARLAATIVALTLAVVCSVFAAAPAAQAVKVEYDDFCTLDVQTKNRLFAAVSPDNRAELIRTQLQRWLDKNRARLSPEQVKVVEENIAFIKADLYRIPRREEDMQKAKELEQRTLALMSRADMTEAVTIFGSCIAKGWPAPPSSAGHDARFSAYTDGLLQDRVDPGGRR
jgi:hypothetical protein